MHGLDDASRARRTRLELGLMGVVVVFFFIISITLIPTPPKEEPTNFCPQPAVLYPKGNFENSSVFWDPEYAQISQELFSAAIQIPTVSYDDLDENPKKDPRFEIFFKFQDYLENSFPLATKVGRLETVNTHGLVFTFDGLYSARERRPILLMSHQDVVPANEATLDQWEYPPFSGYYDGEWVHGRGASDTKNTLVAMLEAIESLLKQNWQPDRTLIVAFGFDEEIGGGRGAAKISELLVERYGRDSLEAIVDEGVANMAQKYGANVASPAVAEKGHMDIDIVIDTPGGHSSVPPDHTGIGFTAELVTLLENHPFQSSFSDDNPLVAQYQCLAEHAPNVNKELRRTILDLDNRKHRKHLKELIESKKELKYLIRTSQAVDIIQGGVKINALPEQVVARVNYRIAIDSSAGAVFEHVERLALIVADKYDLGFKGRGDNIRFGTNGNISISSHDVWEPAPVSPHSGNVWSNIAGTTKHIFEEVELDDAGYDSDMPLIITPTVMGANTDTRHFWSLSRSIYRFSPVFSQHMLNYHTVNERLRFDSHIRTVAWFYEFIINSTVE